MEQGLASEGVATLLFLLITVLVVAVASKYIRVPYTVALVIAGLLIALTEVRVQVGLTPDLILFIFIPALLFESAYNLPFGEMRDNLRPIALLAMPGVILTAVFLAAGIHFTTNVGWGTAFLFGTIMSATDPVSVLAIFKQLGAPKRLSTVLEGESLFNDGTSLVLFRIVLAIVITGEFGDPVQTVQNFVVVVVGALALGAAVGYGISLLLSRVNDYLIETTMTLVVAYGTYLLAEQLHVSGVIAVVVAGLVVGNFGRNVSMSPTTRLSVSSSWEFFGFLANSLIFLLIGLELNIEKLAQYIVPTVLAIASVLIVRAVVVAGASWLLRYIHRPLPYRWQGVLVWGGLRGSLALAMALSLPLYISPGQLFPNRDLLQVTTFGVILFSLLVQGLTMGRLLERLGIIHKSGTHEEFEMLGVRRAMARAALAELDRIAAADTLGPQALAELRQAYTGQIGRLEEALSDLHLREEDLRLENLRSARRRIIQVEKSVVQGRYREGAVSEETMRHLLAELDSQLHAIDQGEEVPLIEDLGSEASRSSQNAELEQVM